MLAVITWVLRIELDGEWEECVFLSRDEAVAAFVALSDDYKRIIRGAVLFPVNGNTQTIIAPGGGRIALPYLN